MKKPFWLSIILFVLCSFGVALSYTSTDFSNANYLAENRIITKQTMASKYRLDDKILRQEVIGIALKVQGITLPENYTCKKYFADATKNAWVCRAVELAADNGIITRSNKYANPGKGVTRAEALAMLMKAGGIDTEIHSGSDSEKPDGVADYFYVDANTWQKNLIIAANSTGIISPIIDSGNLLFYPNRNGTRAEVFEFTKNVFTLYLYRKKFEFDRAYSNGIFGFQYPSKYFDLQTKSFTNISLEEKQNTISFGSGDRLLKIMYYTNISSDTDILNALGYKESESCKNPYVERNDTLPSGAILITPRFGVVEELCGFNFAYEILYFPSRKLLIYIPIGNDPEYYLELLNPAEVSIYGEKYLPGRLQNFIESFKVVIK